MSRLKPPDYEDRIKTMWRENAREIASLLQEGDKDLLNRIATYVDKFGFPQDVVEQKIMQDPMFAAIFAKEPRRQNPYEPIAAQWLREHGIGVEKLPSQGGKAFYVYGNGAIRHKRKNESPPSKSLDFRWIHNGITFYAMHKYTKEEKGGGTQTGTLNEISSLLDNYMKAREEEVALIIIADGGFYTEKRMRELKLSTRIQPPLSFAIPIQEVPAILETYYGPIDGHHE